jgi:hypothetical protein
VGAGADAVAMTTARLRPSARKLGRVLFHRSAERDFHVATVLLLITLGLWLAFGWHRQWWFILWDLFVTIWWVRAQIRAIRR